MKPVSSPPTHRPMPRPAQPPERPLARAVAESFLANQIKKKISSTSASFAVSPSYRLSATKVDGWYDRPMVVRCSLLASCLAVAGCLDPSALTVNSGGDATAVEDAAIPVEDLSGAPDLAGHDLISVDAAAPADLVVALDLRLPPDA